MSFSKTVEAELDVCFEGPNHLSGSQTGGSDPRAKEQITGKTSQAGIQNEIWT